MSYRVRSVLVSTLLMGVGLSCMIHLQALPGTAGNLSPTEVVGRPRRALTKEDLIWITDADGCMQQYIRTDTIPTGQVLKDLSGLWHDRFAGRQTDSIPHLSSPLKQLASMQVDHISTLLDRPDTVGLTSGTDSTDHLTETALAVRHLSYLLPLVTAARDSLRSSLLVVSSVGCECELERCAKMAALYDSIQTDSLPAPMAMVDLMQIPPLEDLIGPVDIPYWILFTEDGRPATLLAGDADPEDIRPTIASWLGSPPSRNHSLNRVNPGP